MQIANVKTEKDSYESLPPTLPPRPARRMRPSQLSSGFRDIFDPTPNIFSQLPQNDCHLNASATRDLIFSADLVNRQGAASVASNRSRRSGRKNSSPMLFGGVPTTSPAVQNTRNFIKLEAASPAPPPPKPDYTEVECSCAVEDSPPPPLPPVDYEAEAGAPEDNEDVQEDSPPPLPPADYRDSAEVPPLEETPPQQPQIVTVSSQQSNASSLAASADLAFIESVNDTTITESITDEAVLIEDASMEPEDSFDAPFPGIGIPVFNIIPAQQDTFVVVPRQVEESIPPQEETVAQQIVTDTVPPQEETVAHAEVCATVPPQKETAPQQEEVDTLTPQEETVAPSKVTADTVPPQEETAPPMETQYDSIPEEDESILLETPPPRPLRRNKVYYPDRTVMESRCSTRSEDDLVSTPIRFGYPRDKNYRCTPYPKQNRRVVNDRNHVDVTSLPAPTFYSTRQEHDLMEAVWTVLVGK